MQLNIKTFPPQIDLRLLSNVELVVFDFDGVFTDNTVYIGQNDIETVKCWRGDGLGLEKLKKIGIKLHIVSTETNPVVSIRARKLNIDCHQGAENKAQIIIDICNKYLINPKKTMFVGNDINDIPAFTSVGIPVGVSDSHEEIYPYIIYKTKKAGGMGAVREICDLIFDAKKN